MKVSLGLRWEEKEKLPAAGAAALDSTEALAAALGALGANSKEKGTPVAPGLAAATGAGAAGTTACALGECRMPPPGAGKRFVVRLKKRRCNVKRALL